MAAGGFIYRHRTDGELWVLRSRTLDSATGRAICILEKVSRRRSDLPEAVYVVEALFVDEYEKTEHFLKAA